ncbi:MAG: 2-C-methyl-D-erythritol 4-phosphate cytidylyltransferase [Clostridia bacterium]|nr:2-C-methyl-D-erythritol 4-phosphate cytidylyltransferase [Clostridia bacterium]
MLERRGAPVGEEVWSLGLFSRKKKRCICGCVVPAAGLGSRMQGAYGEGKQLIELRGTPVLVHTLTKLEHAQTIDFVVVAVREEELAEIHRLVQEYGLSKVTQLVVGGETRMQSVAKGLAALPPCDLVAIHDGARPLASSELIDRVVQAAQQHGAAIPGVAIKDSVKIRNGQLVQEDLPRDRLVTVQTPQVFPMEEYDAALAYALEKRLSFTDDAAVYASVLKKPIYLAEGEFCNLKLTTPEDVPLAEFYLGGGRL